jgi:hypothetical protein
MVSFARSHKRKAAAHMGGGFWQQTATLAYAGTRVETSCKSLLNLTTCPSDPLEVDTSDSSGSLNSGTGINFWNLRYAPR